MTAVRNSGFLLREAASAGNLDGLQAQLGGLDGVDVDDAGAVWAMGTPASQRKRQSERAFLFCLLESFLHGMRGVAEAVGGLAW